MTFIEFQRSAINPGDCIINAWNLVTNNFWMYIGVGLLTLLLITCIPIANLFIMGPVLGGFYYIVLRDMRGEPVEFGMMFKGFEKFVPLMVIGLLQSIPGVIFQVLQYSVDLVRLAGLSRIGNGGRGTFFQSGSPDLAISQGVSMVFVLVAIGFAIFTIIWTFAFHFAIPLIVENDIPVGEAIRLSASAAFGNAGGLIVLAILGGLVGIVGTLALCVGYFVAVPVIYASFAFAYRQVFPMVENRFNMTPPPPTAYGSNFGSGM
jgi:uncharacterized membrane protein